MVAAESLDAQQQPVLPEYASRSGGLYVIVPTTKHLSVAVSAFRTHLVERLKQLTFE